MNDQIPDFSLPNEPTAPEPQPPKRQKPKPQKAAPKKRGPKPGSKRKARAATTVAPAQVYTGGRWSKDVYTAIGLLLGFNDAEREFVSQIVATMARVKKP